MTLAVRHLVHPGAERSVFVRLAHKAQTHLLNLSMSGNLLILLLFIPPINITQHHSLISWCPFIQTPLRCYSPLITVSETNVKFLYVFYDVKLQHSCNFTKSNMHPLRCHTSQAILPPRHCISELMLNYRYVVYDTKYLYFTYKLEQLTPRAPLVVCYEPEIIYILCLFFISFIIFAKIVFFF